MYAHKVRFYIGKLSTSPWYKVWCYIHKLNEDHWFTEKEIRAFFKILV